MEKVLGTNVCLYGKVLEKLIELGYNKSHKQFRIICKCKSMADANRKVFLFTEEEKTFVGNSTSETWNEKELSLCEKSDVWVTWTGTNEYFSMESLS